MPESTVLPLRDNILFIRRFFCLAPDQLEGREWLSWLRLSGVLHCPGTQDSDITPSHDITYGFSLEVGVLAAVASRPLFPLLWWFPFKGSFHRRRKRAHKSASTLRGATWSATDGGHCCYCLLPGKSKPSAPLSLWFLEHLLCLATPKIRLCCGCQWPKMPRGLFLGLERKENASSGAPRGDHSHNHI